MTVDPGALPIMKTFYFDNKEASFVPGETYLNALARVGIEIPTLCHEEELKPSGACRVCVIELVDFPRLISACSSLVTEGARVLTHSKRVRDARKTIIELILASHPLKCIVCSKQGRCSLEKLAYQYVPREEIFKYQQKALSSNVVERNEFFYFDVDQCIKCEKCVRVVDEIQLCDVLTMSNRGVESYPTTGFGLSFQEAGCVGCGNCVAVCPVDALVPLTMDHAAKEVESARTVTTCVYCGVGCQFEVVVDKKNNKVTYVDSYRDAKVNGLALCVKGRYGWDFAHHPDRLTSPLIRKDGELQEATWEEAMNLIEERFKLSLEKYGAHSFAFLSSAKCTNEENYLMQKLARAAIGTNNIDHCARLCHASTVTGLVRAFGSGAMTNSIVDLTNDAEVVFIIGSNTTHAHPVIGSKLKQAVRQGKTKLIVADPREIELADSAEIYMQQLPGSDIALINGMLKVILEENLADQEFISTRTEGIAEFKENLATISLSSLAQISGVPEDDIRKAARMYAQAKTAAIVYSMGITQHSTGTYNVLSLANLAMLTGNVGKPGTGVNPLRGQNNVQGACDLGALPNVYPGYQNVEDPIVQEKFKKAWGKENLDALKGLTLVEMMEGAHQGDIKTMYIMGENPALSDPNVKHVIEALQNLEFLVVQDLFLSETAQYADVVLPVQSFLEKEGTFTNTERRVQLVRKALQPHPNTRADWEVLTDLLQRFGIDNKYSSPADIMTEIAGVTPIYGGVYHHRLGHQGLQWPVADATHPGTPVLHSSQFTRGKGKFHPVNHIDPDELPDEEFNMILTTGRNLYHFHTGEMTHRSKGLHERRPLERSEIHPEDAFRLGIQEGDKVAVSSRRGTVETLARVTDRIKPGVVFMTFHHKETVTNILTNDALDPYAKIPEFKVCAIKIQKL